MNDRNPYRAPASRLGAAPADDSEKFSPLMVQHLNETKPWVRLLAILGFVATGLVMLAAIGVIATTLFTGELAGAEASVMILMGGLYLGFALIYLLPSLALHRYANAIEGVTMGGGSHAIEDALGKQMAFWRLMGILALVMIALFVLALVAAVVAAIAGAAGAMESY